MDFSLSENQEVVRQLAETILADRASPDRVKEIEASTDRFDRDLWAELSKAGLLGIAVPEAYGGSGMGLVELCLILEQQGRRVAPVPLLATLVSGAKAIAEHGSLSQREEWLPRVVAGQTVLSVALAEPGANDPATPSTTALLEDGRWRIDGTKVGVPYAHVADRILVPARSQLGKGVFMVSPTAPGVELKQLDTTNREPQFNMQMTGVVVEPGDLLIEPGDMSRGAIEHMVQDVLVGLAALQVGVVEEALRMTATYLSERLQFGRPLATNQAVAVRAADAYIDTEAMRATMWQAAWRLASGLEAGSEVLVAKWWASEAGHRVVHAVQHLHGGLGSDVEYPVHRYFLWGKQIETTLGGAHQQLDRLGRRIADAVVAR